MVLMATVENSCYRARYYDPQTGRFVSEDPLEFRGNGPNFYDYAGNDSVDNVDPNGCGFIDCVKAIAELERALQELATREAENAAARKCDKGHDKAIEQAKNRVRNALAKARTCLPKEKLEQIWDRLKMLDQSLVNGIVNWLNTDPRQNWPWIYGPMPSTPGIPPPVLPPASVPVPIVP